MKLCTILICIAFSAFMLLSAQQAEDNFLASPPSEQTFQEIETVTKPSIRARPGDADDDDYAQGTVPIGDVQFSTLVILALSLGTYVILKKKNAIKN